MSRMQANSSVCKQQESKAKTTRAVHKEQAFKEAAISWTKQSKQVQGLDVLNRCKRLNEFLSKGLLAEVELDDEAIAEGSTGYPAKAASSSNCTATGSEVHLHVGAAAHKQQQGACAGSKVVLQCGASAMPNTPRQPLTSRISAKESAALLGLLECELGPDPTADKTSRPNRGSPGDSASCKGSTHCQEFQSGNARSKQHNQPAADKLTDKTSALPLKTATCPNQVVVAADDDSDLVGLLNPPDGFSLAGLPGESSVQVEAGDLRLIIKQHRAAVTIQRHVRGTLVRLHFLAQNRKQQAAQAVLQEQAAACLQRAVRCFQARRMLQVIKHHKQYKQQQSQERHRQPLSTGDKQESISAAWRGYYQCHGNPAACVIQRFWRAHNARQQYQKQQAAAVALQAGCRGWLVRKRIVEVLEHNKQQRQQRLVQQESLKQQRQQRKEAALVMQCCIRRWLARRMLRRLQVATCAARGLTGEAAVQQTGNTAPAIQQPQHIASTAGPCLNVHYQSDIFSRCEAADMNTRAARDIPRRCCSSNGSECLYECTTSAHSRIIGGLGSIFSQSVTPRSISDIQYQQQPQESTCTGIVGAECCHSAEQATYDHPCNSPSKPPTAALTGRQLLIRSAADMRTAAHHGGGTSSIAANCTERLAKDIVRRAGELQVEHRQQQASLAARVAIASSSFRKLEEAMVAVKSRTDVNIM